MKPNSDAAILRGEEIEAIIDEIKALNQQRGDLLESIAEIDANLIAIDWNGQCHDVIYHFKPELYCGSSRSLVTEEVVRLVKLSDKYRSTDEILSVTNKMASRGQSRVRLRCMHALQTLTGS